jgi:hypothetical protein
MADAIDALSEEVFTSIGRIHSRLDQLEALATQESRNNDNDPTRLMHLISEMLKESSSCTVAKVEAVVGSMVQPFEQRCGSMVWRSEMEQQLPQLVAANVPVEFGNAVSSPPAQQSDLFNSGCKWCALGHCWTHGGAVRVGATNGDPSLDVQHRNPQLSLGLSRGMSAPGRDVTISVFEDDSHASHSRLDEHPQLSLGLGRGAAAPRRDITKSL